jgi:hypothetical protein
MMGIRDRPVVLVMITPGAYDSTEGLRSTNTDRSLAHDSYHNSVTDIHMRFSLLALRDSSAANYEYYLAMPP